ncbi:MAG: hypothetical protein PHI47_12095 [Sulfuricurvum sp.]|uniref:hypothetical protein n=1 Tax=Sulfuricurvum sp. TaxID=2025608 RepID=UPI0026321E7D|nr:hypothetical protein [Sulfuricurvum sp.]MDD5160789.1 hypothetical protein [Sulfuricurvum sp.]
MFNDETYLLGWLITGSVSVFGALYGVYRWYVRKNRMESIRELKDFSRLHDSKSTIK